MSVRGLVKRLPYPIKQGLKYAYGALPPRIRYGKVFWETYNFLQESQWWSREKLEEYQMQQLSTLLHHAYQNVPYYRTVFDERGFKPNHIQDFGDLRKLPYLTKDLVRENLHDLIARNIPREQMEYVTTGGSTGIPLGLYIEKKTNLIRMAFEWREWNWMGYGFGDRCVVLRGNVVRREESGRKAWWEYDRGNNYLILSAYDMTDELLPKYVQEIEEFKPKVIRGYPSALDILARFIRDKHLTVNTKGNIKAISTSSENLYPGQRKMIEEVFGCKVFDKYGNVEQVTILGECEKREGYHDFVEYSYTEILDREAEPVTKDGEIGEIVGTGFTNYAMPLIRYKTEDSVEYTTDNCSCRRELPLIRKIEGRLQEIIVTKDKRCITLTALIFAQHFRAFGNIKELQLVQKREGELQIKIVRGAQYSVRDEREILSKMQGAVGAGLDIDFDYVDHIPRTQRGKYRFLIQLLPIELQPGEVRTLIT